ncbi:MAG: hypothetical protein WBN19_02210 [Lutimonas sp.]
MARQNGILKITGKLDDLSFYKGKDGYLVRTKGGITKNRIQNDPAFVRTRENGAEFGQSAYAGKLLRVAVRNMLQNAGDSLVTSRLTQVMSKVKNYDVTSARGDRKVSIGLTNDAAKALLKEFNFNDRALLGTVLFAPYTLDTATGEIAMASLNTDSDITAAAGATHVSLQAGFLDLNFETGISDIQYSPKVNLPVENVATSATLTPAAAPTGTGNKFYLLMLEFFQEINGVQYSLKNGAYNVLAIVGIDAI